jgi:hypothetical protein
MAKKRLVLKTSFSEQDVYRIFRDAALAKHAKNEKVKALVKKKKTEVTTRLELKNMVVHGDMDVLVEIFEVDGEN